MVSAWVLVGAMILALTIGFVICLVWTGRPSRSEHSFYDPAVSVSATIERANAQPDTSEPEHTEVFSAFYLVEPPHSRLPDVESTTGQPGGMPPSHLPKHALREQVTR